LVDVINGEDPFFVGGIPSAADLFFFEEEDGEHGWGEVARFQCSVFRKENGEKLLVFSVQFSGKRMGRSC